MHRNSVFWSPGSRQQEQRKPRQLRERERPPMVTLALKEEAQVSLSVLILSSKHPQAVWLLYPISCNFMFNFATFSLPLYLYIYTLFDSIMDVYGLVTTLLWSYVNTGWNIKTQDLRLWFQIISCALCVTHISQTNQPEIDISGHFGTGLYTVFSISLVWADNCPILDITQWYQWVPCVGFRDHWTIVKWKKWKKNI